MDRVGADVGMIVGRLVGILDVGTELGMKLGAPDGCPLGIDDVGIDDGAPVAVVQSSRDVEPFSDCGVFEGQLIQFKSLELLYVPALHSLHIPASSAPLPAGQVEPH